MLRSLWVLIEFLAPFTLLWFIFPIITKMFNTMFGKSKSKSKKDIKKARKEAIDRLVNQYGGRNRSAGHLFPPEPPRPRIIREGGTVTPPSKLAEEYEVRGGRIVKKSWEAEKRLRDIELKKAGQYSNYVRKQTDERMNRIKDKPKIEQPIPKKKHFNKGANPDFL